MLLSNLRIGGRLYIIIWTRFVSVKPMATQRPPEIEISKSSPLLSAFLT